MIVESPAARSPRTSAPPALLVSVRNAIEAAQALDGGSQILDVKEPARGPLGMADPGKISGIVAVRNERAPTVPVSVALGEVIDWNPAGADCDSERVPVCTSPTPLLASGITYFKLGTASLGSRVDWPKLVEVARERARSLLISPGDREHSQWILVAYADWRAANSPAPGDVLTAAVERGFRGLLIDTWTKHGKNLLECLTTPELRRLATTAERHNLSFGLAGQLRQGDLSRLGDVPAALVGIRSAACVDGRRDGEISPTSIRAFREALQAAWSPGSIP